MESLQTFFVESVLNQSWFTVFIAFMLLFIIFALAWWSRLETGRSGRSRTTAALKPKAVDLKDQSDEAIKFQPESRVGEEARLTPFQLEQARRMQSTPQYDPQDVRSALVQDARIQSNPHGTPVMNEIGVVEAHIPSSQSSTPHPSSETGVLDKSLATISEERLDIFNQGQDGMLQAIPSPSTNPPSTKSGPDSTSGSSEPTMEPSNSPLTLKPGDDASSPSSESPTNTPNSVSHSFQSQPESSGTPTTVDKNG